MIEISVSFWFVLVSTLIYMALGFLWYSPNLFGHEWKRLTGQAFDVPSSKTGMGKLIAASFVSGLIMTYAFALVLKAFEPQTLVEAISVALIVWLGVSAATNFGDYLYLRKSKRLFLINNTYNLAVFVIMATLFMFWH